MPLYIEYTCTLDDEVLAGEAGECEIMDRTRFRDTQFALFASEE